MPTCINEDGAPVWASYWLCAAGIYNLVWGALTIAFPHLLFDLTGVERVNYPEIWQCVGMIVGVYGIGYLIAAGNPRRHWPIVLVGLLGKIFGPIGFLGALWRGTFPPLFGLTILTNDLVWWIPFGLILLDAARAHKSERRPNAASLSHFRWESRINASSEQVFRFHESAEALRSLIPPWEKMQVSESAGSLLPGSRVVLRGNVGPIPVSWVAIHTEYEPPHLFADRQESGPFAWWYHRHHILDDGEGTLLRDEVEYQVPLWPLGDWLGGWFVRRKLERMFDYRHKTTRSLVESGVWESSSPTTGERLLSGEG
ncbi:SRPBCC family protein [Bythopirellula goksoeyrii]|uniref:Polyketide cyclase / dehydrase and lipid transport n=1 Tax=Bythopirellula goksoeyrii TaxID=1400387 RepID=A0A5B9QJ65_9BACT|nr:SRPBCC family protein [Bythopirellula goksoeyrii]QEG37575.1 Polyketide cyclase / dehydrase and lipid transport [Bythopirellula goksoeyrii]